MGASEQSGIVGGGIRLGSGSEKVAAKRHNKHRGEDLLLAVENTFVVPMLGHFDLGRGND